MVAAVVVTVVDAVVVVVAAAIDIVVAALVVAVIAVVVVVVAVDVAVVGCYCFRRSGSSQLFSTNRGGIAANGCPWPLAIEVGCCCC